MNRLEIGVQLLFKCKNQYIFFFKFNMAWKVVWFKSIKCPSHQFAFTSSSRLAVSNKWIHERGQEFRRPCGLTEVDWSSDVSVWTQYYHQCLDYTIRHSRLLENIHQLQSGLTATRREQAGIVSYSVCEGFLFYFECFYCCLTFLGRLNWSITS